jgi:hypothetical protein
MPPAYSLGRLAHGVEQKRLSDGGAGLNGACAGCVGWAATGWKSSCWQGRDTVVMIVRLLNTGIKSDHRPHWARMA